MIRRRLVKGTAMIRAFVVDTDISREARQKRRNLDCRALESQGHNLRVYVCVTLRSSLKFKQCHEDASVNPLPHLDVCPARN